MPTTVPFHFVGGPSSTNTIYIYRQLPDCKQRQQLAFNHEIEISLPSGGIPNGFSVSEPIVYTAHAPLAAFLNQDFLQKYIHEGEFTGLSVNSRIDCDNAVAFLPNGRLMITVDRDTYRSLGLIGRPSSNRSLKSTRYDIVVDLRAPSFQPSSAQFKRLQWCLQDRTDPCFLAVAYTRNGRPEEIVFPPEATYERLTLSRSTSVINDIPFPTCLNQNPDCELTSEAKRDLFHWIGALSCSLSSVLQSPQHKSESYASGFSFDQLDFNSELSSCWTHRLSGFIPESVVNELIDNATNLVKSGATNWAVISVFGFADAPVSWATKQSDKHFTSHHYEYEGDNHYVLVILPDLSCIQFLVSGALDDGQ